MLNFIIDKYLIINTLNETLMEQGGFLTEPLHRLHGFNEQH